MALSVMPSRAAITQTINYQGFLTDKATGLPIDGTRDMQFRLCDTAAGSCASALFSESRCASGGNGPAVGVAKGRYGVEIGSSTSGGIPATVFTSNSAVWLEVLVDTNGDCAGFEALSPRLRLQASAYAFNAMQASTASVLAANGANCAAGNAPLGVDGSGVVEGCFDVATQTELNSHTSDTAAHSATNLNTGNTIVRRDASGNFSAGTITAALSGNASTASSLLIDPVGCSAGDAVTDIAANGALTCQGFARPGSANTWSAVQTFNQRLLLPGNSSFETTGRLGIGTGGPAYPLHISGTNPGLFLDYPSQSNLRLQAFAANEVELQYNNGGGGALVFRSRTASGPLP